VEGAGVRNDSTQRADSEYRKEALSPEHVARGRGPAGVKHGALRRSASGNRGARVVVSPAYSVGDLEEEELRDG
jgi:hypothetical protein